MGLFIRKGNRKKLKKRLESKQKQKGLVIVESIKPVKSRSRIEDMKYSNFNIIGMVGIPRLIIGVISPIIARIKKV